MKYRKWVRCKCQIYIRDLTFSADPDETTIHVYVCKQQKNNLQVRTRTLGICHKMSFDCFHFLFNMEQVDKKRKILSDISNTHDKHSNRSDNCLIISPMEMLPKIEGRDNKENCDKNLVPDKLYLQNALLKFRLQVDF